LGSSGYYASFSNNGLSFAVNGDDVMASSDAASANSAIAVGAYNSKISYVNTSGNTIVATGETYGEITSFSSHGPTADGRTKPNITGPGSRLVSSINAYSNIYNSLSTDTYTSPLNGVVYRYAALQGTSMSSPAVAGIIALMLEADPTLTPGQVQVILCNTAIIDAFTGVIPANGDNVWGWGKINAYGAIYATLNFAGIYHDMNSSLNCLLYPNPSNGIYQLEFDSEKEETVSIEVNDLSGKTIEQLNWNLSAGVNTYRFDWTNFSSGIYLVKIVGESGSMNVKVVKE
jgi:minor extracellular serine protease Vpr